MCLFKRQRGLNSGVRIRKPLKTDYIAGVSSKISYEVINPSGDWTEFLPSAERQSGALFDTMACVTFSALNSLETQLNFLIRTGLDNDKFRWLNDNGYVEDGKVNFSDRFTAKMSGTTNKGNYLGNVWDSIRNQGILPEKDWKFDLPTFDWNKYYEEIPQELKNKALKFKELFDVQYEWVTGISGVEDQLKHAPIQIVTKVCSPWNTSEIIKACGIGSDHATLLFDKEGDHYDIFDHYIPFNKRLANDFPIPYMMKGIIKERVPIEGWIAINYVKGMTYGNNSVVMTTTDLKVRQSPTTLSEQVGLLKKGKTIEIVDDEFKSSDGYLWQKVRI